MKRALTVENRLNLGRFEQLIVVPVISFWLSQSTWRMMITAR